MHLHVEETGPLERRLRIEIATAEVDRAFDAFYRDLGKTAQLKGFRPGKVPRPLLERHFGEHARHEVLETLVRQTLGEAIEQAQLQIVSEPRLQSDEPPAQGASFSYGATVEIRPDVELRQVEGLEVGPVQLPEPETDPVEGYLEQLREGQAQLLEVEPDTAAARGHVAVVDFDATLDGQPFEGGSARETTVEIGSGRAVPGFEEQLIGLRVGESRRFELQFPAEHGSEEVAGRTAQFEVVLRGLKRKELPALDDELAKDVSEFETLEALRADVRRRVEEGREAERQRLVRERTIDALIAANPFPLPHSLVEAELHAWIDRMLAQLDPRVPEERRRQLAAEWHEQGHARAERATALAFLVPRIAETRGVEVRDEDVDARLAELAQSQKVPLSRLKRAYQEANRLPALRAALLQEQVVEFLVSKAILAQA
jgi:trigger factor